jgi:hypothetical protein
LDKFKTTFDDPALDQFDDAICSLHRFEDIRHPDLIVAKGMLATINVTSQPPPLNSSPALSAAALAQPIDEPSDHERGQQERDDQADAGEHRMPGFM